MQSEPAHGPKCEHTAADVMLEPLSLSGGLDRSEKCAHPMCQLAVHSCAGWSKSYCCKACEVAHAWQQPPDHGLRCEGRQQGSSPDPTAAATGLLELFAWYRSEAADVNAKGWAEQGEAKEENADEGYAYEPSDAHEAHDDADMDDL